jgi:hypothetical protein
MRWQVVALIALLGLGSGAAGAQEAAEPAEPLPSEVRGAPARSGVARVLREVSFSVSGHDVDGLWSGRREEHGVDLGMELVFNRPLFSLWSGTAYPTLGFMANNQGYTSKVWAGFLWTRYTDSGLFFSTGLGLASHNGERETDESDQKQLGSRLLFRIPIEVGYAIADHHRVALAFDHISNAWLADENEGMDTLGVRYFYAF